VSRGKGKCKVCAKPIEPSQKSVRYQDGWKHASHAAKKPSGSAVTRAEREFERNKARIESGETFASQKPSDWHRKSKPPAPR